MRGKFVHKEKETNTFSKNMADKVTTEDWIQLGKVFSAIETQLRTVKHRHQDHDFYNPADIDSKDRAPYNPSNDDFTIFWNILNEIQKARNELYNINDVKGATYQDLEIFRDTVTQILTKPENANKIKEYRGSAPWKTIMQTLAKIERWLFNKPQVNELDHPATFKQSSHCLFRPKTEKMTEQFLDEIDKIGPKTG